VATWTTRASMACKGSGVQIPSALPQVRGPLRLRPLLIRPLGQQMGSNLCCQADPVVRRGWVLSLSSPGSPEPAAGGWVVSHGFAACCGRTVCPSVARPQDLLPGNGLGSGLGRRHQFHPPGKRAWQPVARLESSPAAKTDGGNRLEPLILAVFSRVRLIRPRPAWFACVAFTLVSRGVAALVIQGGTGPCGSVQISWAEQPAESGPRAYVSGWSRVSLMPPARPASHARRWSSISNRRPLRRASETHCRDAPGLIPLCSRRCRRTLALGRPHLRRA